MKRDEAHRGSGALLVQEAIPDSAKLLIREAVAQMLGSVPFRTSRQCQDLLRYVVEHSLAQEEESLRERVIGTEVFGRRPDYDTAEDPVVRIRAADVRKRIALYYQSVGAGAGPVRVDIPHGSYRAFFEWVPQGDPEVVTHPNSLEVKSAGAATSAPENLSKDAPIILSEGGTHSKWAIWPWLVAACICLVAISVPGLWRSPEQRAFNRFWSPVLDGSVPTLIYVGSNAAYSLSSSFIQKYRQQHDLSHDENMGREFFIPLPAGEKLDADDFVALKDTYVTIGDVAASTKITSLLAHHNKAYDIRFGGDIVFGDLQQSPTILIGAFNNSWTLEMTNNLRFIFAYDHRIEDRFDKRRTWTATDDSAEDYALISRILNSKTGQVLVTVAGIGQAGTRAAGNFLTNPKALSAWAKNAPKGWDKRNLQVVLHTSLVNGVPSAPDVVASYYW